MKPHDPKLPNLLIIGAMKCATTSLYMALRKHPAIFCPDEKEPHALINDDVLSDTGRLKYASLYERCTTESVRVDASTGYSKFPDIAGVPNRALRVLGDNIKVIYMVRDPIDRIISQFRHEQNAGECDEVSFEMAIRNHSRFVSYSSYHAQMNQWLNAGLREEQLMLITFEEFTSSPRKVMTSVLNFLGIELSKSPVITPYNKSEQRHKMSDRFQLIRDSPFYRQILRPYLPLEIRLAAYRLFLPRAKRSEVKLEAETAAFLWRQLETDQTDFFDRFGWRYENPGK